MSLPELCGVLPEGVIVCYAIGNEANVPNTGRAAAEALAVSPSARTRRGTP